MKTKCILLLFASASMTLHLSAQTLSMDSLRATLRTPELPSGSPGAAAPPYTYLMVRDIRLGQGEEVPASSGVGAPASQWVEGMEVADPTGLSSDPELDAGESFTSLVEASTVGVLTNYPMSTMCKLFMEFPSGTNVCSGTMISSNVVITAGHCLYDYSGGTGWTTRLTVMPSYDYGMSSLGYAEGVTAYVNSGWTSTGGYDYDVAWAVLDRPLGNTTGWLGFGYTNDLAFYTGNTFHNFGYPAASPYNGEVMYYRYGPFDYHHSAYIVYAYNASYGGQSGSSAYWKDPATGNRYFYANLSHGETFTPKTGFIKLDAGRFSDLLSTVNAVHAEEPTSVSGSVVFPTVVDTELMVGMEARKGGAYSLFGMNGVRCGSGLLQEGINVVDVSGLAAGLYLMQVTSDQGVTYTKVKKQ